MSRSDFLFATVPNGAKAKDTKQVKEEIEVKRLTLLARTVPKSKPSRTPN